MSLFAKHKETEFGVGDVVRVTQSFKDGEKTRTQAFEGTVIRIKGRGAGRSFTVRRIGSAQVGIEKIFPLSAPTIESVAVVKKGTRGVRRAKLYYIRKKSRKEISKIYSHSSKREILKKKIEEEKKSKKSSSNKTVKANAPKS